MFRRRTDTTDTEDTESTDYISSEESVDEDIGSDSSDNEAKKCLLKRPLPWRSEFLNEHFEALDKRAKRKQKYKRHGATQRYERRVGDLSKRGARRRSSICGSSLRGSLNLDIVIFHRMLVSVDECTE